IDPKHDVLSLEDLNLPRATVTLSTIDVVVRWADANCLDNLRRLAIPYYTWRKASICKYLYRLMEFKALEELY
ncbi:hypothetical protein LK516_22525, partial [Parabacteroides distasonis]|uniref:hypothetical protein n=1 Tax=Parabacteroides distasonis TaxID=823 RepID=UPI001D128C23